MSNVKRVNANPIDLSDWRIVEDKELNAVLCPKLEEALNGALEEERGGIYASLPFEWWPRSDGRHGPPVENPLMIYFSLPLGADEDNEPEWGVDLAELIDGLIDLHVSRGPEGPMKISDVESREIARRMRDALLAEAGKLSDACDPPLAEPAKLGPKLGPNVLPGRKNLGKVGAGDGD